MAIRYDDNGDVVEVAEPQTVVITPIDLPETDDLKELAASAIPHLVRRAITLANASNRLTDVVSVLKELADRAYGKPHQAVEHTGKITHETLIIQRSVPALPVIEAEVKEIKDEGVV